MPLYDPCTLYLGSRTLRSISVQRMSSGPGLKSESRSSGILVADNQESRNCYILLTKTELITRHIRCSPNRRNSSVKASHDIATWFDAEVLTRNRRTTEQMSSKKFSCRATLFGCMLGQNWFISAPAQPVTSEAAVLKQS